MNGYDSWPYIEVMTCSSQISWPLSPFSTTNEETFPLCPVWFFSLCSLDCSVLPSILIFIKVLFTHLPPQIASLPIIACLPPSVESSSTANNSAAMHNCWWVGVKNRRQINWIIKNMQMNSFQFKCRFWHFSAARGRMSARRGERKIEKREEARTNKNVINSNSIHIYNPISCFRMLFMCLSNT